MISIDIRNSEGHLLVRAPTLSEAINHLVQLCENWEILNKRRNDFLSAFEKLEPDISTTAMAHRIGFKAGWLACQNKLRAML